MMEISEISTLIIAYAPAITAVIGVIVSLFVGIAKIRQANKSTVNELIDANKDTVKEIKESNAKLLEANAQIIADNLELKKENIKLKQEMGHLINKVCNVKEK